MFDSSSLNEMSCCRRYIAIALVALLIAMQSSLTYLVTPMVQANADTGQVTVMLCTLQGLQEVTIDLGSGPTDQPVDHCPALELHKLIASGVVDVSMAPTTLPAPRVLQWVSRPTPDYRRENYPAFSGRAPPLV